MFVTMYLNELVLVDTSRNTNKTKNTNRPTSNLTKAIRNGYLQFVVVLEDSRNDV